MFCAFKRNGYGPHRPPEGTTSVPLRTTVPGPGEGGRNTSGVAPPQPPPPTFAEPSNPHPEIHPRGYSSLQRNHDGQHHLNNHNQMNMPVHSNSGVNLGSLPERGRLTSRNHNQLNVNRLNNDQNSVMPQNGCISRSPSPLRHSVDHRTAPSMNTSQSPVVPPGQYRDLSPPAPSSHNRSSSHDRKSNVVSNGSTSPNPPAIIPRKHKKHPNRLRAPQNFLSNQKVNGSQNISQLDRNLANHLSVKDSHLISSRGVLYTVASTPL